MNENYGYFSDQDNLNGIKSSINSNIHVMHDSLIRYINSESSNIKKKIDELDIMTKILDQRISNIEILIKEMSFIDLIRYKIFKNTKILNKYIKNDSIYNM